MHYVVEYGDERGNQRETIYSPGTGWTPSPCAAAVEDLLLTLRLMGVDPESAGRESDNRVPIADAIWAYIASAEPWETVFDLGNGDNPFTVFGYDSERGIWSVSLVMIREV